MLTLAVLLCTAWGLSTGLDGNKEACFGIQGRKQGVFQITYVVSGFQEENFEMRVSAP